jgi:hypothetical protein
MAILLVFGPSEGEPWHMEFSSFALEQATNLYLSSTQKAIWLLGKIPLFFLFPRALWPAV